MADYIKNKPNNERGVTISTMCLSDDDVVVIKFKRGKINVPELEHLLTRVRAIFPKNIVLASPEEYKIETLSKDTMLEAFANNMESFKNQGEDNDIGI